MTKILRTTVFTLVIIAASAPDVMAQATDLASQTLGRAYWHVFAAYAVGWLFILGWIIVIARRLASAEQALNSD